VAAGVSTVLLPVSVQVSVQVLLLRLRSPAAQVQAILAPTTTRALFPPGAVVSGAGVSLRRCQAADIGSNEPPKDNR
jgi:hypothetical protein